MAAAAAAADFPLEGVYVLGEGGLSQLRDALASRLEIEELKTEIEQLKTENATLAADKAELSDGVVKVLSENKELEDYVKKLIPRVAELAESNAQIRKELEAGSESARVSQLEKAIEKLRHKYNKLLATNQTLGEENERLKKLNDKINGFLEPRFDLSDRVIELTATLDGEKATAAAAMAELQKKCDELKRDLGKVFDDAQQAKVHTSKRVERAKASAEQSLTNARNFAQRKADDQVRDARAEAEQARAEAEQARAEAKQARAETERLKRHMADLEHDMKVQRRPGQRLADGRMAARSASLRDFMRADPATMAARAETERARAETEKARAEAKQARIEVFALRAEVTGLRDQLDDNLQDDEQIQELRAQLVESQRHRRQLQAREVELQNTLGSWKATALVRASDIDEFVLRLCQLSKSPHLSPGALTLVLQAFFTISATTYGRAAVLYNRERQPADLDQPGSPEQPDDIP